jgi:hypothetical protein
MNLVQFEQIVLDTEHSDANRVLQAVGELRRDAVADAPIGLHFLSEHRPAVFERVKANESWEDMVE